MSIVISIYDIFAFTVPGLLYLFVINEWLRTLNYSRMDLLQFNLVTQWALLLLLAYLIGQVLDFVGLRLWVRLWYRQPDAERAYKKFLSIRPDEKTTFRPDHWSMLFVLIQREDRATAERIDRNIAIRILLRNASFGLLIFSILQFFLAVRAGFVLVHFLTAIGVLALSFAALRKSDYYNILLYTTIFQHAALYGKNIQEILSSARKQTPKKSRGEQEE